MERCRTILDGITPDDYLTKVIELDAHGHTTKDIVFQNIEEHFGLQKRSGSILYKDFLKYFPDTCVPFPRMQQTLQRLREQEFSLGLVTNGSNASQNPKIDGLGIRRHFGTVLISEAEGMKKPDPKIFHLAMQNLNVTPEETVFVGDNPEADIRGAQAVGMKAIWMRDSYWPEPDGADAIISELCELPDVVERFNKLPE
jgi:putative hydrolase of the HAD superfamily